MGAQLYGEKLPCTPESSSTSPSRLSAGPKLWLRPVRVRNIAIKKPRPDRAMTVARPTISMPHGSLRPVTMAYPAATSAKKTPRIQKIRADAFMSVGPRIHSGFLLEHVVLRRDLRMVQVEGRPLGADARQRVEVVPRRRAGGGPFEGGTEAPGVVDLDLLLLDVGQDHVEQEGQGGGPHDEGTDGRDLVHPVEIVLREVVHVPARGSDHSEPVLDQEGHVEPDDQQPEVQLADPLGELVA